MKKIEIKGLNYFTFDYDVALCGSERQTEINSRLVISYCKFLLISKGIDIYDVNLLKLLINSGISFESAFMVDNIVNKLINNLILNNDDY